MNRRYDLPGQLPSVANPLAIIGFHADVYTASIDHHRGMTTAPSPASVPAPARRSARASTLGSMILASAERHTGAALRFKRNGAWTDMSFAELADHARTTARGLIALGIRPGDRVALLASTSPGWTLADCATLLAGATVVPIYQTNSPEECGYVLAHSGARAVFVEDVAQLAKVTQVRAECPALEHVIVMSDEPASGTLTLSALRARASEVDPAALEEIQRAVGPDDVATIIYTSGTTGPPKGCMATHANFLSVLEMYERQVPMGQDPVIFMFLPLAHSLARVVQMFALDTGSTLAYWQGDATRILDDVLEARPTHFPSVPRVFEKIHTKATTAAAESGRAKRAIFSWALDIGARVRDAERAGRRPGALLRPRHALADRLVLSKVRSLFGGQLRIAMTGAAPIGREILEFFDACGVIILEGYGMSETCAAATLNTLDAVRFGTVGRALPGSEVAIADDGEILMRGPHLFKGYYRDPAATEATFDGDWLCSGDLGALDEQGFLRITGRKKDLIITSSGKNIAPSNIESALRESRWISQAVVYGDRMPYLVALLTLDPEEVPALAAKAGCEPDIATMIGHPGVRAEIQKAVDAANARFARIEQIKRFALLGRDLTLGEGDLTPTLKVKRNIVSDRYREVFEGLYES
jgi:long-chain acyl-CoA synthetase